DARVPPIGIVFGRQLHPRIGPRIFGHARVDRVFQQARDSRGLSAVGRGRWLRLGGRGGRRRFDLWPRGGRFRGASEQGRIVGGLWRAVFAIFRRVARFGAERRCARWLRGIWFIRAGFILAGLGWPLRRQAQHGGRIAQIDARRRE